MYTQKEREQLNNLYRGILPNKPSDLSGGNVSPYQYPYKLYCRNCKTTKRTKWNDGICQVCGKTLIRVPPRSKTPRKKASKRTWKQYEKLFVQWYKK